MATDSQGYFKITLRSSPSKLVYVSIGFQITHNYSIKFFKLAFYSDWIMGQVNYGWKDFSNHSLYAS